MAIWLFVPFVPPHDHNFILLTIQYYVTMVIPP